MAQVAAYQKMLRGSLRSVGHANMHAIQWRLLCDLQEACPLFSQAGHFPM